MPAIWYAGKPRSLLYTQFHLQCNAPMSEDSGFLWLFDLTAALQGLMHCASVAQLMFIECQRPARIPVASFGSCLVGSFQRFAYGSTLLQGWCTVHPQLGCCQTVCTVGPLWLGRRGLHSVMIAIACLVGVCVGIA